MNNLLNIYLFLIGLAVGSFLNVLIDRLSKGKKITGRSKCDYCHKKLEAWDLIPVISFIIFGGKSRCCHKKISFYYPLVEIVSGISFLIIFNFKFSPLRPSGFEEQAIFQLIGLLGIISCLIVIFFADFKYQIIPDSIQIALFIFILLFHVSNLRFIWDLGFRILNLFVAGLAVMLPILILWAATKGKGMGFGDVKLAFNIGFLFGIKGGLLALYFAFIIGAIVGLFLILIKKTKLKSKIAFGPFIVIGTIIMIFYQEEIFTIINRIYGL